MSRMEQALIKAQDLSDEKLKIVSRLQELIDFKTRQLEADRNNQDIKNEEEEELEYEDEKNIDDTGPQPPKRSRTQSPTRDSMGSINPGNTSGSVYDRSSSTKDVYGNYYY